MLKESARRAVKSYQRGKAPTEIALLQGLTKMSLRLIHITKYFSLMNASGSKLISKVHELSQEL